MQTKFFKIITLLAVTSVLMVSCTKDLDRFPKYDLTSEQVYKDLTGYKQVAAKLYAGLSLTGNSGPDGQGDIRGIDEGFSSYMRQYWQADRKSVV